MSKEKSCDHIKTCERDMPFDSPSNRDVTLFVKKFPENMRNNISYAGLRRAYTNISDYTILHSRSTTIPSAEYILLHMFYYYGNKRCVAFGVRDLKNPMKMGILGFKQWKTYERSNCYESGFVSVDGLAIAIMEHSNVDLSRNKKIHRFWNALRKTLKNPINRERIRTISSPTDNNGC